MRSRFIAFSILLLSGAVAYSQTPIQDFFVPAQGFARYSRYAPIRNRKSEFSFSAGRELTVRSVVNDRRSGYDGYSSSEGAFALTRLGEGWMGIDISAHQNRAHGSYITDNTLTFAGTNLVYTGRFTYESKRGVVVFAGSTYDQAKSTLFSSLLAQVLSTFGKDSNVILNADRAAYEAGASIPVGRQSRMGASVSFPRQGGSITIGPATGTPLIDIPVSVTAVQANGYFHTKLPRATELEVNATTPVRVSRSDVLTQGSGEVGTSQVSERYGRLEARLKRHLANGGFVELAADRQWTNASLGGVVPHASDLVKGLPSFASVSFGASARYNETSVGATYGFPVKKNGFCEVGYRQTFASFNADVNFLVDFQMFHFGASAGADYPKLDLGIASLKYSHDFGHFKAGIWGAQAIPFAISKAGAKAGPGPKPAQSGGWSIGAYVTVPFGN